jgi:hypothetical protein
MARAYISGRISGRPHDEVEREFAAAEEWLQRSFEVRNPLKNGLDRSDIWAKHMVADIDMLLHSDCVWMLPGWKESKGARIEEYIARECGMIVYYDCLDFLCKTSTHE